MRANDANDANMFSQCNAQDLYALRCASIKVDRMSWLHLFDFRCREGCAVSISVFAWSSFAKATGTDTTTVRFVSDAAMRDNLSLLWSYCKKHAQSQRFSFIQKLLTYDSYDSYM